MSTREVIQSGAWSSAQPASLASAAKAGEAAAQVAGLKPEGSAELFRHVADVTPALLCVFDLDTGRNLYVNDRVTEFLGSAGRELTLDCEPLYPEDRDRVRANFDRLREMPSGEILEHEFRIRHADGGWRWLCTRNVVLSRDGEGHARQLLILGEDVTERKRIEEELRRANAELARSNKELEDFASLVAHDLRAPLISLSGCAAFLKEEAGESLSDECREMVRYIDEGTRELSRLINSVLHYSRAGHARLDPRPCSMAEILQRTLIRVQSDLSKTGALVTHDPLPLVEGDEELLGQLLQNLIENALKYRSARTLEVHVSAREEDGGWVFSVRDNGIGIDPGHFERIFRIFERVRRGSAGPGGLGVGLATCKRVIEKHGGRIWVESEPGLGSTFFFALPRSQKSDGPA